MGCLFGFLAVAAGAFGAHALKDRLPADLLAIFETGVRYQLPHAVALLFAALLAGQSGRAARRARWAGWLLVVGILIFSGSLYLLALSGVRSWGAVTPVGGVAFLAGWAILGWAVASRGERQPRATPGREAAD
ncbi:MAG: DUF423 domain-containing protein [Acidobacteria bacterium]|nr:DUF423 domain-containing protein [Acidobacteriota bacterium]